MFFCVFWCFFLGIVINVLNLMQIQILCTLKVGLQIYQASIALSLVWRKPMNQQKALRYVMGTLFLLMAWKQEANAGSHVQSMFVLKALEAPVVPSAFPDVQAIIAGGVLKVAVCKDERPPFFFTDKSGDFKGLDINIAEAIGKALGVKVQYIRTAPNFDEVAKQVSTGEAHIAVSKLSFTEKRMKQVIYVYPYITLHVSLLVNRSSLEQMPGLSLKEIFNQNRLSITAVKGSSQVALARQMFPNAEVIEAETMDQANELVATGKCFARVSDDNELRKLLLVQPGFNLKCVIVALKETEDNIHVVASPHCANLASVLESLMRNRTDLHFKLENIFKAYEQDIKDYYKK